MKLQRPRGTKDLDFKECLLYQKVTVFLAYLVRAYGYQQIQTPLFELAELFLRVGDATDIVTKELYVFEDKKGRKLALRPEGTAPIVRAVLENNYYDETKNEPLKLYYEGPMYRYERPQLGRQREFHQFGVECFGAKNPIIDCEILSLACNILKKFQLKNWTLEINYFGSALTKQKYQMQIITELACQKDKLCDDCLIRYVKNPFRVLDCKICQYKELNLSNIAEFWTEPEQIYFNEICDNLNNLEIPYRINSFLVRGIDYYTGLIFELLIDSNKLGMSQATVLAGGRYDELVNNIEPKKNIAAIGFALGLERLMLLVKDEINFCINIFDYAILNFDKNNAAFSLKICEALRWQNLRINFNLNVSNRKNIVKNKHRALENSTFVVIMEANCEINKQVKVSYYAHKQSTDKLVEEIVTFSSVNDLVFKLKNYQNNKMRKNMVK